jgi:hypothetical protein
MISESTNIRTAGAVDYTAKGSKRQRREVRQALRVEPWTRVQSTRFG